MSSFASPTNATASPFLAPLSWIYGAGRVAHQRLYDWRVLKRRRLSRPVICVGNLTIGGTGKTPFLIELLRQLTDRGLRAAVISRGYGARPPATRPRIVTDGQEPRGDAVICGDEPLLIGMRTPGVPVVICSNRYEAGVFAEREFDPDVFVLDDGYQHEALEREVNLLLWDVRDLPSQLRQLPVGRLRESPRAASRASAILLTHAEYLDADAREKQIGTVRAELEPHAPGIPFFTTDSATTSVVPFAAWQKGEAGSSSLPAPGRVMLLSGIARPQGFEKSARSMGLEIAGHLRFSDHIHYDTGSVARLRKEFQASGADRILTTEKDAVKLMRLPHEGLPIEVAVLSMSVAETQAWGVFLDETLAKLSLQTQEAPAGE